MSFSRLNIPKLTRHVRGVGVVRLSGVDHYSTPHRWPADAPGIAMVTIYLTQQNLPPENNSRNSYLGT